MGYRVVSDEFFNEFVLECPKPVAEINRALAKKKIIGGYDLSKEYPHIKNGMLIAVTEMNTREQMDALVAALAEK